MPSSSEDPVHAWHLWYSQADLDTLIVCVTWFTWHDMTHEHIAHALAHHNPHYYEGMTAPDVRTIYQYLDANPDLFYSWDCYNPIREWIDVKATKMDDPYYRELVELHIRRMERFYLEYERALLLS